MWKDERCCFQQASQFSQSRGSWGVLAAGSVGFLLSNQVLVSVSSAAHWSHLLPPSYLRVTTESVICHVVQHN